MTTGTSPSAALDTMEFLVGANYRVERRASVGLAIGRGLDDAFGSPELRGVLSVTFVSGQRELPPIHPPPPPKIDGDADGDGIKDSVDKCPTVAEDKDGFEDEDGCPDPDNDKDGIPDAKDKCPLSPEDKDGFQDEDGCPDLDNDKDGILDDKDKCPLDPEDKDGFQDGDGCPDPDNDKDGILDTKDKCPNQPETINGVEDEDGCPDKGDSLVVVSPDRLDLLDAVKFTGTRITKQSLNLLGQIAATLRAHDEIVRVRVTSHVQPSGNPAADKELTERRAKEVREWLINWGISAKRLEAKGFGGTKPIIARDKKGAAATNDRLELIILEKK
jgi:outer membrane protein OmpA-like peptidoglycan-associated protein